MFDSKSPVFSGSKMMSTWTLSAIPNTQVSGDALNGLQRMKRKVSCFNSKEKNHENFVHIPHLFETIEVLPISEKYALLVWIKARNINSTIIISKDCEPYVEIKLRNACQYKV